jgi:hypothetical protein
MGSGGGIGRHAGLKILWAEMPVRVRFPSRAHYEGSVFAEPFFVPCKSKHMPYDFKY